MRVTMHGFIFRRSFGSFSEMPMRIFRAVYPIALFGFAVSFLTADNETSPSQTVSSTAETAEREKRIPWTTSRIVGSPEAPAPYRVKRVFPQLEFKDPVSLIAGPEGDRFFMAELAGRVTSFSRTNPEAKAELCFDVAKEIPGLRRIYSLAFHPQFQKNRYVFLTYVTEDQHPTGTSVSRFKMRDDNPPTIDPASETAIIQWRSGGHNGGCLKFGPDGYLYISTGDASPPNPPDVHATGQDLSDLLAAVLRIDVDRTDGEKPYRIPEDNPFIGEEGPRPEIWSYGFRNPWKMSFDPHGNLWTGDVGWELWEMVYRIEKGGNYGWSIMEGPQPVRTEYQRGPTPILPPTAVHSHIESRSITGGYVYRGNDLPQLKGQYIYGDYVTGKIWSLPFDPKTKTAGEPKELTDSPLQIITFGEDPDGELYVVDYLGGIYVLEDKTNAAPNADFPTKLSETGLFQSVKDHEVALGVIPYSINAEPWEDGAMADRLLAIPGAPTLELYETSNAQIGYLKGHWKYPNNTVFVKTLSLDMEEGNPQTSRRIETQLLHYDEDTWRAYTFEWNEEGTDAELVPAEGRDRSFQVNDPSAAEGIREQTWRFASRTECIVCHVTRAGSVLGFHVPQLDRPQLETDRLTHLTEAGLFRDPYGELAKLKIKPEPPYPDPYDESAPLDRRARTYLQVNCAHCHLRGGGGTAPFELLSRLPLEKTGALAARPTQGSFDIYGAEVISPGDPYRSVLYHRMATLGKGHMPHIGSERNDERGLQLIHDWIASLPAEPNPKESDRIRNRLKSEEENALAELKAENGVAKNLDRLLGSTSGALRLSHALAGDDISTGVRDRILKQARETSPPIRGLFERFLPPEERTKRLGTSIKPEVILALKGDGERGRELFLKAEGVQCRNCHQVGPEGKDLGPKLDGIAKRLSPKEILESMLEPSKKIDPKYVSYLMETSEGQVHSGLLVKRTGEEVVLKDAAGKLISVPASEVEQLVPQQKSIMPELLLRDLTAEQVADLLAFLNQLK